MGALLKLSLAESSEVRQRRVRGERLAEPRASGPAPGLQRAQDALLISARPGQGAS